MFRISKECRHALYSQLQQAGTLAASDMEYVDEARASLQKVRAERAARR